MRVGIESRPDPRCATPLDQISGACCKLGCNVARWVRGTPVPECDVMIVWNGMVASYNAPLTELAQRKTPVLFAELGWLPQDGTFQLDESGINADASWAAMPIERDGSNVTVQDGPLLVCLQVGNDTSLTRFSPWFRSSDNLLAHLASHSQIDMVVRAHPLSKATPIAENIVASCGRMTWDHSPSLKDAMQDACAVACINSTCGIEAMELGLPVLCYGRAIYRQAAWRMTDDAGLTRTRTQALKDGHCDLTTGAMAAMIERIRNKQWTRADLPGRLAALFHDMKLPQF